MFERFTEKAIKVIMLSQEESRRLGHNFVGTEQLLLGLIAQDDGIAALTLKSMGVNLKEAREEVKKIIGQGSGFVANEIPFTPRAKKVLELSWDEAKQLGHDYIEAEHLLLAIISEKESVAAKVLENLGVDLNECRFNVVKMLAESSNNQKSSESIKINRNFSEVSHVCRENSISKKIEKEDDFNVLETKKTRIDPIVAFIFGVILTAIFFMQYILK